MDDNQLINTDRLMAEAERLGAVDRSLREGYNRFAGLVRELGASNTSINPVWVQRLVGMFDRIHGEASVLMERCVQTEIRAFRSELVDRVPDLRDDEHFKDPPLNSVLLVPSCTLLFSSHSRNECYVVVGYLWDYGKAYLVLIPENGPGMLQKFQDVMLGRAPSDTMEFGISEATGKTAEFIKWLCGTVLTAKQRVAPTPGHRYYARKEHRKPPQPYYIVHPSDSVQRTRAEAMARGGLEFRHLRRAHLRLLLERSSEPLAPREGWQLLGPADEPGPKLAAHLRARGHLEKQANEWFLVRISSVEQAIVGPEDKPFVPSAKETGIYE
jgi:hypothetical protein